MTRRTQSTVLTPAGKFRVLVVIVNYPGTVGPDAVAMWETAQSGINQHHADFAKSRGYASPLVAFDNTNLIVSPEQVDDPRSPASVRAAVERRGVSTADFQIIMTIDLDPAVVAGGTSNLRERSVYVGNYSKWTGPLGPREWRAVASTAYHHEVAHYWGWPATHDWTGSCGGDRPDYAPFIAPPMLFGWEDVDGDRVPEILSATPYGRPRSFRR